MRTLTLVALIAASCALAQDSRPTSKPLPKKTVMERLKEQTINLNMPKTPLADATEFVNMVTGLNVVIGYGVERDGPVTVEGGEMTIKAALDAIGSSSDPKLTWSLLDGTVIHFHEADTKAPATPKVDAKWTKEYGKKKLTLNLPDTSLGDAAEFLIALHGLNLDLSKVDADMPLNLNVKDVHLPTVLTLITEQVEATWTVKEDVIHFVPAKKKK